MSHKIEIKKNSSGDGVKTPTYLINYGVSPKDDIQRNRSATIIHSLTSGSDTIIDIRSDFFSVSTHLHDAIISSLIENFNNLGYKYRYSKGSKEYENSLIEKLFRRTKKTIITHRITSSFGANDFKDHSRYNMLPFTGVWYYFMKNDAKCGNLIEQMHSGSLCERALFSIFSFAVFDYCAIGRMGIFGIEIPEQHILGVIRNIKL